MADLKVLVSQRKTIRKKVTDSFNRKETYVTFTSQQKLTEHSLLTSYKQCLQNLDSNILGLKYSGDEINETSLDTDTTLCQEYQDKIDTCLSLLAIAQISGNASSNRNDSARSLLKQPTAPLPKFSSGKDEDLVKFFSEFESTTGPYNYPDRDLLLLLKQQVEGRAKVLLSSLEADKQKYNDAKDLLITAFASDYIRKCATIRRLTELKLKRKDDPFTFISHLRTICESVKLLKITADDFLQYFSWHGLPDDFQKELIQITGDTHPSISSILDSYFIACERYENSMNVAKTDVHFDKGPSKPKSTVNLAVKVNSKLQKVFNTCSICSKVKGQVADHALYKCLNYPTPEAKLAELKSLNGCVRCASLEHKASSCAFRFKKKCFKCNQWHFSFLCSKVSSPQKPLEKSVSEVVKTETNSGIAVFPNFSVDCILPTFTFSVPGHNGVFWGLKDSGSQNSYVTQNLVRTYNFKSITEGMTITVNGFNGPKTYVTKIVEVPMRLGNSNFQVSAIVVPNFDVHLKLPLLGTVVEGFTNKGYTFADLKLSSNLKELTDVDFILGADAAHCVVSKDVLFGEGSPSLYIDSPHGIMIIGNINRLAENLPYLPRNVNESSCSMSNMNESSCSISNVNESSCSLSNVNESSRSMSKVNTIHAQGNSSSCGHLSTQSFFITDFIVPSIDDEIQDINFSELHACCNLSVLNDKGKLIESKLQDATNQILESECQKFLNYDQSVYNDESREIDNQLVKYALSKLSRENDGRIQVPLLWNGQVAHLLSRNETLAKLILKANLKKLGKNQEHLFLMDQTIKDQISSGIIEPIENLDQYKLEHPNYSFLSHMGIFKLQRESTKCRIVFLSNLRQDEPDKKMSISHNQCMFSGPTLNQKLSSALIHLRFDEKLITYDLKKAFNMLSLKEGDQARLLFYWYRNVHKGDFSLVAYRNVRLSFGLRCSPFLLMIALYYILVLQVDENEDITELKKLMYALLYMDNGAISTNSSDTLLWAYTKLPEIFLPYKFEVQQMVTNDIMLQRKIDEDNQVETPTECKLLGLTWDRVNDLLYTQPINLDGEANTKRSILKTIASHFDVYGFNLPILNRCRLFMHRLQCCKELKWDKVLNQDLLREWRNICRQANSSIPIKVARCVGRRESSYKLIAFTDASRNLYGTVVYLHDNETGTLSFLQAKNRMVCKQLKSKSIPALELNAIVLGVETLMDLHKDISGPDCIKPVKVTEIILFTDSICSLHWLHASSFKLEKMQKHTPFIMNRINRIQNLCEIFPVHFCFISGKANPADVVTRCISYRQLEKSGFIAGPDPQILNNTTGNEPDGMLVIIPNPLTLEDSKYSAAVSEKFLKENIHSQNLSAQLVEYHHLIDPGECSSFRRLILTIRRVLTCIHRWRYKENPKENMFAEAIRRVILVEQSKCFPDIFQYFQTTKTNLKDIPNLVNQLNIYPDSYGILRVRSKFHKWMGQDKEFPILLHRDSVLTKLIIVDAHEKLAHSGCYSVLSELRKHFHIPKHFSTIKKVLKQCVHCKRFNNRTFKYNQNFYRDFRADPPRTPFANVFVDHLGPFTVKVTGESKKIWLLCIACTWTRAINLKICNDLSVKEFLRALQLHCFEYGIPELCISDPGSQLTAGANLVNSFLSDPQTQLYFEENNVKPLTFHQYYKGCSKLGSLVEVCVKMVKRLLFGSIKNLILNYFDFEYIVCHTVHLVNRRPIAFKESVREGNLNSVPEPITPEHLLKGYEITSLNLIPDLHRVPDSDPEWKGDLKPADSIRDEYYKLRKVRHNLIDKYHSEFIGTLVSQAVDEKDRYKPVTQHNIKPGDIVLLKEVHTKPNNYPMGLVKKVEINSNNEVTGAHVLKGKTNEVVKRHISTLIPFLESDNDFDNNPIDEIDDKVSVLPSVRRKAAIVSEQRTRDILSDE